METKNNLNVLYQGFEDTLGKGVIKAVSSFWENDFQISLSSVNEFENIKDDPLLKGELFYTCQISIKNKQHITLRVSSDFIRIVFHDTFNSSYPLFDLEKLTELERKILNEFFEYIVKNIDDSIIKETEIDKIDPLCKTNLNFVFLIKNKEINAGKLSMNAPLNRLKTKSIVPVKNFDFEDFVNNFVYVNLITGCTKITLNELKNLEKDDILLLENSNIKTMTLKTDTIKQEFKVNPEPSIMIDMDIETSDDEIEYKENNGMQNNKTMWDDIQIEVSAEFKKVKMTLGELKQITKGLVIDLGPIMNNEISLLVENKTVAKGELVIINDKYGVKITDVFASKSPVQDDAKPLAAHSSAQAETLSNPLPSNPAPEGQKPPVQPPPKPLQSKPQGAKTPGGAPPARRMPQKPQGALPPKPSSKTAPQETKDKNFDYSNFEE